MNARRSLRRRSPERPIRARSFAVMPVMFLILPVPTNAVGRELGPTSDLTETEVVARALARGALTDAIDGAVLVEEGRGRVVGAYPNPQLSYMREQTFGSLGTGEDYLSVDQTIDLGRRRALHRDAAEARARAARRDGDALRLSIATDARLRFFEVLFRQTRIKLLQAWVDRSDQALVIVTRRERRGDAARYDRSRLERERAVATGRLETEQATLERVQARLQALIGGESEARTATGTLLPAADPVALPTLRASRGSRPDLLALDLRIDAAALDRAAASRWWAPDLRIEAGWKGVDLGRQGRVDGFLLGASLSLPLWYRATGIARIADGEAQAARGRRALIESELGGEVGGARAESVRLRRAALTFREQTSATSGDLVRIAAAGYEGGELGILELLDAYRGATDDALAALDMEYAARRARIDLDRLTGAGLP